ncbi:MAG: type II secretion system secretin GspD [Pseudobdellovibrionaceae bacterium]
MMTPWQKSIVLALALQMTFHPFAKAQFDEDFAPPPPPEFDSNFGGDAGFPSFGSESSGGSTNLSAGDKGPVKPSQKNRLATAPIEEINNKNFPETIESFDFPSADITDIVKAISELTGKNFIVDPGVRGKITIIAPTKITVAEAYKAFLSALAINGFAVVPSGKFYKIRSARNAHRDYIETYSGQYYPNSDQMITRIIHLKHISVEAVNRDLRILASKDGELSPYPQTNSLIISDYGSNIDRVMKIIEQLDVPGFDDQLEVVPVKFARAKDIAELIDRIVNRGDRNQNNRQGSFSSGVPRFSRTTSTSNQGSAFYMVIPDDRTNSLIVTGNKAGIERVKKLLRQLDFKMRPEDSGGVYVYYVKHGEAEKIAQTLSGIAKDSTSRPGASAGASAGGAGSATGVSMTASGAQPPQEIFGGDVKITADKGTNSLVVVSSKQDYDVVLNLLNKLDIPRDQVFVEAIIMEMRSNDASSYEIGYFQFDKSGSGAKVGFNGFSQGSLVDLLNPASGAGTILGFGSGDTVQIRSPTGSGTTTVSSLVGFVNFLKRTANANILSTPSVIAMDNQEATIKSGDRVVVGFDQQVGTNGAAGTRAPKFEDADIMLKLKPFISPSSNTVRMEIETSVKQISTARTPKAFESDTQPLAKREINTNIVVPNGDTAVMGGLQKVDDVESVTKVPLLGDIPILGWLFKSRNTSQERTNMLIFLTPKILRSGEDSKRLLGRKLDERLDFVKSLGGRDPHGKKVDEIQKNQAVGNEEEKEVE